MHVIRLEQVDKMVPQMDGAKGVLKQIPLSRSDGSPRFSFRVFTIEPGGHTPFHRHAYEHMNYVISGEGAIASEDRVHRLQTGDFALVLPGEPHQYRNCSQNTDLVIICAVPKEYE